MKRYLIPAVVLTSLVASTVTIVRSADADKMHDRHSKSHLVLTNDDGVAVNGFDVVSYFTKGRPVAGQASHATKWRGATWQFSSAENLRQFEKSPEQFAPQYGGYCAWGVAAKNDLFPADPNAWKIVDKKLFLNFNTDVQKQWLAGQSEFIAQANKKWPGLVKAHREKAPMQDASK